MQSMQHPRAIVALLSAVLLVATGRALAVGSEAGAISLTFGPSARGEAMGGLFVSEANDYAARWSNPGGLAFVGKGVVGTMFTKLVPGLADDVYLMYGGWVQPIHGLGTLQLDVTYLSYGQSEAVNDAQQSLGTFSSYEVSPSASLGFKFLPNLGLGLTAKYVRIDLAPESVLPDQVGSGSGSGNSWAFDLGGLYSLDDWLPQRRTDSSGLARAFYYAWPTRIGVVVNNLGPDITFIDDEQSDPLPRSLRAGFMNDLARNDLYELRAGFEYERSLVRWSRDPIYHLGGEFTYLNMFALRAGYLNDNEGAVKGIAGGFGAKLDLDQLRLSFDYANVPQADTLDRVHRFALWLRY